MNPVESGLKRLEETTKEFAHGKPYKFRYLQDVWTVKCPHCGNSRRTAFKPNPGDWYQRLCHPCHTTWGKKKYARDKRNKNRPLSPGAPELGGHVNI